MERRSELEGGPVNNAPAVLQLHSWSSTSALPVSAFVKAALSPSRELLLLQSRDREVILFPLGGTPSNAAGDITPNLLVGAPPAPPSATARGSASRRVPSSVEYELSHGGSPSVNPSLQTFPSTSYSTPPSNPQSSAPNSSSQGRPSPPSPSLGDVDCFAWASHGDGFGSKGPSGLFKQLLFTSNQEGLYIHGLFPKSRTDDDKHSISKASNGPTDIQIDERTGLDAQVWGEGKWRNWEHSQLDRGSNLRKPLHDTGMEGDSQEGSLQNVPVEKEAETFTAGNSEFEGKRLQSAESNKEIVSYVVDAELEDSAEGLQLRFDKPHNSWPLSAEVITFRFGVESPSLARLISPKNRNSPESIDPITSTEVNAEPKNEAGGNLEQLGATEKIPVQQPSIQIADIISNPSHTLVGIVTCQPSSTPEKSELHEDFSGQDEGRKLGERNALDERKSRLGVVGNAMVSISLILDWGIKWIATIDLKERLSKEARTIAWASLVLTNDRLIGLKQDGGTFVWAASSGSLVAFIDLVKYCDLRRSQISRANHSIANENKKNIDFQEKIPPVETERECSPHAVLSGEEALISRNAENRADSKEDSGQHHRRRPHFTSLVATADSLLLAMIDDQGLSYIVSTDDYFASQGSHSSNPSATQKPYSCREDLKALSCWEVAGSDIGSARSTSLLPDRKFLKSLHEEIDVNESYRPIASIEQKTAGGRESGPGPPLHSIVLKSATAFTSRVDVARNGATNVSASRAMPIRRVFVPYNISEALVAVALSSNSITTMVRSIQNEEMFSITQKGLRILDGAVDERDFYANMTDKIEERVQKRSSYMGDILPFCSRECLYLLTTTALHVVLPPLALSQSKCAPSPLDFPEPKRYPRSTIEAPVWQKTTMSSRSRGMVTQPWQTEVLDRALVCDGVADAELLCLENGWSLQLFHLRRLQLAVDFVRAEDVEDTLQALARVGDAESGVLCLLFAAVKLMLNQHISDNELAQASKLLSSAALFTTRLIRYRGIRGWQGRTERSLKSSRYTTSPILSELARFLEVIRTLQTRLEDKRRGPNIKKAESARDRGYAPSDQPNVRAPLEAIEEGVEDIITPYAPEQGLSVREKTVLPPPVVASSSSPSSSALVATGSWDISPTGVDEGKNRRRSHLETASDMFSRWENENVDAAGVVRDALKSSGRLALAVARLQRMRMTSATDDAERERQDSEDVFSELLRIGRGIVYELFCKGKIALAIAALRRLGEDIESALRDLALGTVGRFLHAQAVKELQRLTRLSTNDYQLFERVSLIEKEYANSSFWKTYEARQQAVEGSSVFSRSELSLLLEVYGEEGLKIECGEVDGVVLGPWSMIDDPVAVEEEVNTPVSNSSGYWAAAAVWLQPWDQLTVDRILLEPLDRREKGISWEAKLKFHVARHDWQAVIHLLETIPSSALYPDMLHVHLDSEDALFYQSLPFSAGSSNLAGSSRNALDDGDTDEAVIPKVQILDVDLTSVCNTLMWQIIEERLVRNHIFLKDRWKGTVELMSLFARAGLLFHSYSWGRHTRSKDLSFPSPLKGSKFEKDAVFGMHELVVQHCLRHTLPHFLELYLDFHSLGLDKSFSAIMQYLGDDCQWALWLLYSGLQRREYDASFANARTILAPSRELERSSEVGSRVNFLPTVDDMAKVGGEMMALSTLMYAPVLLQKSLRAGNISRHERESWQCTLESLRPGLREFPTLWRSLVGVCFPQDRWGFAYGRPLGPGSIGRLDQYLEWQQRLFSCARGDTSILQMTPTWLPRSVKYLLQLTIQGPADGGRLALLKGAEKPELLETSISSWEAAIHKIIEVELHAHSLEDTGGDCEHHLRRGHALAAFNTLLCSRVQNARELKSGAGRLHSAEIQALLAPLTTNEQKLIASVIPAVIMDYENSTVVAAFAFFVELCGLSANLLRVDIASLRRICNYMKSNHWSSVGAIRARETSHGESASGGDVTGSLAGALADEYVRAGVNILSSSADERHSQKSRESFLTTLQLLEKASLKDEGRKRSEGSSPGAWLFSGLGDGLLVRTMQWSVSESWSLVTAFCRVHGLPLSTTYLEILARDNDWVGFLAEAQLEGCPLDVVLQVVSKEFTDVRLQSQLLFVLKNLPGAPEMSRGVASEFSTLAPALVPLVSGVSANAELFGLLADCEGSRHPGKDLLKKSKLLRWPLLAVVASCFTDVTPQCCLTTWLEITVLKETSVTDITDASEQLSARIGAAVDASNAGAGRDSTNSLRYCRTSSSKRQRLSPEEAVAQGNIVQSNPNEVIAEVTTDSGGAQTSQADEHAFPSGQRENPVGEGPTGVGDGGREQESLAALLATLCEQQKFLPLLRAFELFTPTSPFLPFVRFLQSFSQMRISEASAHLASFTARLKEENQQQTRSSKNSTAWITRAAIAAADAMHGACPSAYERRCLLQLLSGSDFGDGGVAAMRYRRLYWKIQLAEPALQEGPDPVTDGANLDDKALFDTLERSTQWEQARSWARQLDPVQSVSALHRVTETQAEAMVTEWKDLLWDVPEERVALWNHCQALFTMHAFPALRAGEFFLKHADALEPELSSSELHNILLVALQWLSGSITNSPPAYPSHLLQELETRVWLLTVESAGNGRDSSSLTSMRSTPVGGLSHEISSASPIAMTYVDRTATTVAVVDSHLKRSSLSQFDGNEVARPWSLETSTSSSPTKPTTARFKRKQKEQEQARRLHAYTPEVAERKYEEIPRNGVQSKVDHKDSDPETQPGEKAITAEEIVGGWEERVGEGEVDRAVLTLLEVGQVTAAKLLQRKLSATHVPLEFSLVEAALKVASLSPLTITGSAVSSVITPDVMEHLQGLLEDVMKVSAIDILDSLTAACREGCGKGLCQRISAIARIADVLGLTFSNAFAKSPTQLLQLLALKGQETLSEAKLLVATHSMPPASSARILAESFLKGLLAAHRGGYMESSQMEEGPAPLLWRPSDFIRWAQICKSEPEIGHALMRLVISGRDMPHACEVELIILAYRYYERSACLDGVDVLVALAATRVDSYLSEGDYSSLARLVTGISNFQALHFIIDFLIENGQLELLLQKRSAVDSAIEASAAIKGFRMAVLSALKRFNPYDLDAFAMVYSDFSMAHEMAFLLESRGRRTPELWSSKQYDPEQRSEESLEMMRLFVEAAKVYSGIDAGNKTSWCCAQAKLISLQLRMPEHMWLNLTDTNARRLLVDQGRFEESLIVAEAYGLNQSAEWVPVIWNQMLIPGRIDQFLNDFVAALPLTYSMLMELARFYRAEVTARGDHNQLDFSKWLTPGGIPDELVRYLSKSFRSLLKHARNMKDRLQLATFATGFPDIVESCLRNIDNMPVTSGPLILRRGHGGTYVPIM